MSNITSLEQAVDCFSEEVKIKLSIDDSSDTKLEENVYGSDLYVINKRGNLIRIYGRLTIMLGREGRLQSAFYTGEHSIFDPKSKLFFFLGIQESEGRFFRCETNDTPFLGVTFKPQEALKFLPDEIDLKKYFILAEQEYSRKNPISRAITRLHIAELEEDSYVSNKEEVILQPIRNDEIPGFAKANHLYAVVHPGSSGYKLGDIINIDDIQRVTETLNRQGLTLSIRPNEEQLMELVKSQGRKIYP